MQKIRKGIFKRVCTWAVCFALVCGLLPFFALADEKIVWEGSEAISWNKDVPGTQYEVASSCFSELKPGDVIKIYTQKTEGDYGDPQYTVTYKAGSDWTWTDLNISFENDVISLTVHHFTTFP